MTRTLETQTENRHQKLRRYLEILRSEAESTGEAEFTSDVLDLAWSVWERLEISLQEKSLCLEIPDACPGQRDNFMFTWSKTQHYLECEIFGTGEIEFFYRNRNTGDVWGEDTTLEQGFSNAILKKTRLFAW